MSGIQNEINPIRHSFNIRNSRIGFIIDSPDNKRIIREHYEQLYANKSNLNELDKSFKGHKLPKVTPGEGVNLNNFIY